MGYPVNPVGEGIKSILQFFSACRYCNLELACLKGSCKMLISTSLPMQRCALVVSSLVAPHSFDGVLCEKSCRVENHYFIAQKLKLHCSYVQLPCGYFTRT